MKFQYCTNPQSEKPILLIDDIIGEDDGYMGIDGNVFQREILELERMGKKEATVRINSPGGSVFHGWTMFGAMINSKMNITTVNIGIAASTAGWLFQAGRSRVMMDYSVLMMHNPSGGDDEGENKIQQSIATMLAAKSKKTVEEVLDMMNETTFMTAEEAHKAGFCDKVEPSQSDVMNLLSAGDDIKDKWGAAKTICNKLFSVKNNYMSVEIKAINSLLNLHDEASNKAQYDAVKSVVDANNALTDEKKQWAIEKKNLEDQLAAKTNEYDALNEKYTTLNTEKEQSAKEAKEAEAKTKVTELANKGHIAKTDEVINEWVNTAMTIGIDKAVALIEKNPQNLKAPNGKTTAGAPGGGNAANTGSPTSVEEWRNQFKTK